MDHDLPLFWFAHAGRNINVSVFQQLSSDKCEFDSIWKQTLLGGSQMEQEMSQSRDKCPQRNWV